MTRASNLCAPQRNADADRRYRSNLIARVRTQDATHISRSLCSLRHSDYVKVLHTNNCFAWQVNFQQQCLRDFGTHRVYEKHGPSVCAAAAAAVELILASVFSCCRAMVARERRTHTPTCMCVCAYIRDAACDPVDLKQGHVSSANASKRGSLALERLAATLCERSRARERASAFLHCAFYIRANDARENNGSRATTLPPYRNRRAP